MVDMSVPCLCVESCRSAVARVLQPGAENDLGDVLVGVLTDAVEHAGPGPQDEPPEVVGVALDLGVEKVDGRVLGAQELLGVVEVLAGLGDRALGVVVELLVLVAGDDVPGRQRLHLVDRLAPWPEVAEDPDLCEIHVNAVVDHVAGDDQPEIRHVEDAGVAAVGVADLDDRELMSFEREAGCPARSRR